MSPLQPGSPKYVRRSEANGVSDLEQVEEGDVPFSTLDPSHVRAIDPGRIGQSFLGKAELQAPLADNFAKPRQLASLILLS